MPTEPTEPTEPTGPTGPTGPTQRPAPQRRPSASRLALGGVGVVGIAYGTLRILTQPERSHPIALFVWLAVAVALHDGVLVPLSLVVGAVVSAVVPSPARRWVQGALVASALVTAVALPLVYRRGTAVAGKALEDQDYGAHLLLLVGMIAAGATLAGLASAARDRRRRRRSAASTRGRQRGATSDADG